MPDPGSDPGGCACPSGQASACALPVDHFLAICGRYIAFLYSGNLLVLDDHGHLFHGLAVVAINQSACMDHVVAGGSRHRSK